jgi:hypothetical protein
MNHVTGICIAYFIKVNRAVQVFVIIFPSIEGWHAQNFFPFFADGKYAHPDVLYLPGKGKGIKIFRLAEFLRKNYFGGHPVKLKILKK